MVLLFLCALGRGIKDVFRHPIGLGLRGVFGRYVSQRFDVFILTKFWFPVNRKKLSIFT